VQRQPHRKIDQVGIEAGALRQRGGDRSILERSPLARRADPAFRAILTGLALGILLLIAFFFYKLIADANPALSRFGVFGFTFSNNWNPSASIYGALPLLVGTLITSVIALAIGVPVAVAAALYLTELCPKRFRGPLTLLVDLLAAVPSVVYGLWGIFVLAPALQPLESSFAKAFSFIPFVGGTVVKPSYFIAGLILAIMILPIVSAISREVMSTVPSDHKEAALALGATRWEMIRTAVLPYSRAGMTGAAMLGLGRAIGETIAVTLVIGAAILWLADRLGSRTRTMEALTFPIALGIGAAQALALVPGISRAGISISAGLFAGLSREAAARFAFLMAMPITFGAGIWEFRKIVTGEAGVDLPLVPLAAGMLASLVAGLLAIAVTLRFLRTHSVGVFVVYRIALAAVVVVAWLGLWDR